MTTWLDGEEVNDQVSHRFKANTYSRVSRRRSLFLSWSKMMAQEGSGVAQLVATAEMGYV